MDPREHLQRVSDLLSGLVEGTDAGRLDDPTPCEDFQVRDLIGHFTMGRFLFAADFAGDTARRDELLGGMPERFGDVLGDDHLATYRDASATLDAAVDGIEVSKRRLTSSWARCRSVLRWRPSPATTLSIAGTSPARPARTSTLQMTWSRPRQRSSACSSLMTCGL